MTQPEANHLTGPFPSNSVESRLRDELHRERQKNREMRQKVDAAGTDDFATRLWANADSLGPNAAFSEGVRQRVRDRGRYENINNGNARGLIRAHSSDLIGTCPRPQLTIPGDEDGTLAEKIERSFMKWGKAAQLGFKCRLLEKQRGHSGDGLAILIDNPLLKNKVKLDWLLVEAEQLQSPGQNDPKVIDGIRVDEFGNRIVYYFLKQHPGESRGPNYNSAGSYQSVRADNVIHWYEVDRPGQLRGLARIASALPIFAQVRRWDGATLTALEFASMIAGYVKSNLPVQDGQPVAISNWDFFEIVKGALLTFPQGYEPEQMESKHPNATHGDFKRNQLNEAGRGSGAPLNITTGNSSEYNYSSARCDLVPWKKEKRIERYDFNTVALDPTLVAWEAEARAVGEIPDGTPAIEEWDWVWHYDGFEGIDPQKDAQTDDMRLKNGTADYAEIHGEYGDDSRDKFKKLVKEVRNFEREGLVHPFVAAQKATAPQQSQSEADIEKQDTAEQRLFAALTENGIPENVADQVVSEFFSQFRARNKPSLNGHAHPIGGRT